MSNRLRLEVGDVLEGEDAEMFLEMMRAGGWSTRSAVVRSSLFLMATQLGLDPHHRVFALPGPARAHPLRPARSRRSPR